MNVLNMDHIEFYVGDARQAAQYLCTAYGFRVYGHGGPETGLPGQRSVLLGQHHIRILLTSGLQPNHPASQFVATHGDGAAVTAFSTDDAAAAFKEAVHGGGTGLSNPRTWADGAGFGDVVSRLVERHGADTSFLPGAIEMVPDADAAAEDGLLRVIDHAAVCVPVGELDATIARHERAFGFAVTFEEYIEVGEQGMRSKVVQSPSGGVTFTFMEPDISRRPGQIDDFLAWHHGAGVQHVAFGTNDIVRAVRTY